MSAARSGPKLDDLLPSTPYVLAYSLPVLFVSVLLTFAGTFLTLDRTRTFPPRYDALPGAYEKKSGRKVSWLLEGGVGGLGIGYAFGGTSFLHLELSTMRADVVGKYSPFLDFLGPSDTQRVLLRIALAKVLLGCVGVVGDCDDAFGGAVEVLRAAFCGDHRGVSWVPLLFVSWWLLTFDRTRATIALSLSVIMHPALLSRVILTSVLVPVLAVLTLLPLAHVQHGAMRLATSATGAFGIVLAIALMAEVPAWADVWERLWLSDGLAWGTQKERGLSATWAFFWALGGACDWFLRRRFGENPDEVRFFFFLAPRASKLKKKRLEMGWLPRQFFCWSTPFGGSRGDIRAALVLVLGPDL
jgi:hypothetical protein